LKLNFKPNPNLKNPPTHKYFLNHLKKYFGDKDMYSIFEYNDPSYMLNAKLEGNILTFDVPKQLVKENWSIENKQKLKTTIDNNSLADGSWESSKSNFFLMMGDNYKELATISYTSKVL
jgi:hypothetical protein